ncbi:MAG: type IV pilin [Halobacteria archaeon]|nr:type IV pilin [Halobacteria archaeon]
MYLDGERAGRAVSPAVGVVLLVAITVLIAGITMVLASEYGSYLNEPAPMVGESSGELVHNIDTEGGEDDQIVRLRHISGDPIDVSEIEIQVDATDACGKTARIVDLPTNTLGSDNYEGDDIFDYNSPEGGELDEDVTDGTWSPGETARFRITSGECEINSGDEVDVRVVHKPTSSVIIDETLKAS